MKIKGLKVHIGGLLRCCLATLDDMADRDESVTNNQRITCAYCGKPTIIVEGDTIKWVGYEEATVSERGKQRG